jgi:D-alanine-D-alanine ligase
MNKTRVIILFGGRSAEHEVSILSARNVFLALDKQRFEPLLIGIDKQGRWRLEPPETLLAAKGDPRHLRLVAAGAEVPVPVRPEQPGDVLVTTTTPGALESGQPQSDHAGPLSILRRDDVIFPVLHGTYGEDGTVQGLLELADVAYVGPGPLGSAVGMDKEVAKRLLDQAGIPVVPWRLVTAATLRRKGEALLDRVAELGFPLFVKPSNAGSSVGVTKVKDRSALLPALKVALQFDSKVLCEAAIDAREVECAVLGNDEPQASLPGEIVVTHADGFYSYDAKYVDADGSHPKVPADIPAETAARIQSLSIATFQTLDLAGLARVDFFLDRKSGALYVNEVNTIPGFTAISMYPKMWEASGLPGQALVTRLIELAIERRNARRALKTSV